jgi:peroxisomal membrane protein 2
VSGPLNHYLYEIIGRIFAGRKGLKYTLAQLLATNLIISPIINAVYLVAMQVIDGDWSIDKSKNALRQHLLPMLKINWALSPLVQLTAYRYLPPSAWVPSFNLAGFIFGTYINIVNKLFPSR